MTSCVNSRDRFELECDPVLTGSASIKGYQLPDGNRDEIGQISETGFMLFNLNLGVNPVTFKLLLALRAKCNGIDAF